MTGMMMFWMVLGIVMLALAVVTRIHPLMIAAAGMEVASIFAWQGLGLMPQLICVAVLLGVSIYLWLRQSKSELPMHREHATSRRSGFGALSNFSAFSDESDEVVVDEWDIKGRATVNFRGRAWTARLARGARARAGLYKVREVREGQLVLDEVID